MRVKREPYNPAKEGSISERATKARAVLGLPAIAGARVQRVKRPSMSKAVKRHFLLAPRGAGGCKRPPDIASDRFLSSSARGALCWFLEAHAAAGPRKARTPIASRDKVLYAAVRGRLPKRQLAFIDWLARHEDAQSGGFVENAVETGKRTIASTDARRAQGGVEGYLAAVAENIEHWRYSCSIKATRVKKSLP